VEPAPAREVSSLVFAIGMQEMVIVGLLFLVIFGPSKLPDMARDLGRFVNEARRSVEEFKEDLVSEGEGSQDPRKGRIRQRVGNQRRTFSAKR
jgi:sec-independent protein translocase protein TatB